MNPKLIAISENFTLDEFLCNCERPDCDGPKEPDPEFLSRLENARFDAGVPFPVNSWGRCAFHNARERGEKDSFHLLGKAIDISAKDSRRRWKIVGALIQNGFSVIIYSTFVHADLGRKVPILLRGKS